MKETQQAIVKAFNAAGYVYDEIESYAPGFIRFFGGPGDNPQFETWDDAREWIENVIFD